MELIILRCSHAFRVNNGRLLVVVVKPKFAHALAKINDIKSIGTSFVAERFGVKEGPRNTKTFDVYQIQVAFPLYFSLQGFLNGYTAINAPAQGPQNVLCRVIPSMNQKYAAIVGNKGIVAQYNGRSMRDLVII